MTQEELIELINEVDSINADLFNQCTTLNARGKQDTDPWIWMEIQYGVGGAVVVKFLDEYLYNTENDEREWIEAKSESFGPPTRGFKVIPAHYEPIGQFLRTRANQLISKLQKIKL